MKWTVKAETDKGTVWIGEVETNTIEEVPDAATKKARGVNLKTLITVEPHGALKT